MKLPAIQFYPGDWLRDNVAGCSLAAQGLWLRMMFVAHDCDSYGKLSVSGRALLPAEIARRCGCSVEEFGLLFKELESAGVPSRDDNGAIFSRRMVRDAEIREERAKAGSKGGSKTQANHQAKLKQSTEDEDEDEDTESRRDEEIPERLNTSEFREAWGRWKQHRKEIKKPLTPTSVKQQFRDFEAWGVKRAIAAINHSIGKGWRGCFEPDAKPSAELEPEDWLHAATKAAQAEKAKKQ